MSKDTHTTESTAPTWRDLAGELTAEQVEQLERWSPRFAAEDGPEQARRTLLRIAQSDVAGNRLNVQFSHVPVPSGAVRASIWDRIGDTTTRTVTYFEGLVCHVSVTATGMQSAGTGSVDAPEIEVYANGEPTLPVREARQLAAMLVEAADVLDARMGRVS